MKFLWPCGACAVFMIASPTFASTVSDSGNTIIVTASRTAQTIDESLASVTVVSREDIEQSQARSIADLLRSVPGIQISSNGGYGKTTSVFLRGGNPSHILVLIDGVRAASASTGLFSWENLSPDQVERIEIVRGPRASLYGSDAVSGVIQIFTRSPGRFSVESNAGSHGTAQIDANVGGGDAWRYGIEAGFFRTDGIPIHETLTQPHGFEQGHATAKLAGKITSNTNIHVNAAQAFNTNKNDADTGDSDATNRVISAQIENRVTANWSQRLIIGSALDDYTTKSPYAPATITTQRQSGTWQNDVAVLRGLISGGLDYWQDHVTKDKSGKIDKTIDNAGLFLQYQTNVLDSDWAAAVRYDRHSAFGGQTTWNVSWGRDLTATDRLTFSYGTAFKAPTVNDLYWPKNIGSFSGVTYVTEGNAQLKPENSNAIELGFTSHITQNASWNANVFHNHAEDLISWVSTQTGVSEYTYRPGNVNVVNINGIEFGWVWRHGAWRTQTSATFLQAIDKTTGLQLDRRPKQTVNLNLQRRFARSVVALEWSHVSERNDFAAGGGQLAAYSLLHATAQSQVTKHFGVNARIENATGRDYVLASNFSGNYNTLGRSFYVGLRYVY